MSISGQNLSIVIVTLKSDKVIHNCIKSIKLNIPIIVIENSKNLKFKQELESQYKNVECILTQSNLGMGAGNNIGIKNAKTNYVMILNPDVILEENALDKIYLASKQIENFSIMAPISSNENYPNFKILKDKNNNINKNLAFKVDYIDGYAMLLDKSKFKDNIFFDENFFLYLENDDLCFRVNKSGGNIFIIPNSKIKHLGSKAVDSKYSDEVELSRNWHWLWSKFYFNKKNFGTVKALKECFPTFISSIIKFLFYLIINNKIKRKKYFNRASGFFNAFLGKPSWYRPIIND
jgi:N-acetylglucosaminyl-diphospho-decaprenol L-rhamnosyltransferase